jgi:hypothetical protein
MFPSSSDDCTPDCLGKFRNVDARRECIFNVVIGYQAEERAVHVQGTRRLLRHGFT